MEHFKAMKMYSKRRIKAPCHSPLLGRTNLLGKRQLSTPTVEGTRPKKKYKASLPKPDQSSHLPPISESPASGQELFIQPGKPRRMSRLSQHKESTYNSCVSGSTYSENTSEMILPSGVSTFLLACMDSDTAAVSSPSSSSACSLSSPEVFREADGLDETETFSVKGDALCWLHCKNSTLLDTSNAVGINTRRSPNLSGIQAFSPNKDKKVSEDSVVQNKIQTDGVSAHSSTSASGKYILKILSSGERTPKSRICPEPSTPFKKPIPRQVKTTSVVKCRKVVSFAVPLETPILQTCESAAVKENMESAVKSPRKIAPSSAPKTSAEDGQRILHSDRRKTRKRPSKSKGTTPKSEGVSRIPQTVGNNTPSLGSKATICPKKTTSKDTTAGRSKRMKKEPGAPQTDGKKATSVGSETSIHPKRTTARIPPVGRHPLITQFCHPNKTDVNYNGIPYEKQEDGKWVATMPQFYMKVPFFEEAVQVCFLTTHYSDLLAAQSEACTLAVDPRQFNL
ncbi:uncharacterized protein LOC131699659 isoform X2 [Acipenser ruthenus]|nr:uncharacterized protein LOC131699659 isoform X2 [Acipenser ruthenus]XP_058853010.1 uncharacterized protein LOC131699659 isoform X2 [Acipenser ruthenus]XP_058853011.1 uncharacterized protein LOC131699659 isoform X2 [Acipenser ruthenus]XP_058853012.1 uncharacterized protein LOC131699659 isoform X2 [Acipenser ruthenus]XP_058853013.1 uncharacterized protein LOC131699659 isoform X2 [Acipenser ruthenus]XP_058853014.1 uncharacterized protein LOC131699659 isoform X2 [Acipenser ruthenus]XP_05885301